MAVDVGSAVGYLDLDISKFLSGLKSAQDEAGKTSTTITGKLDSVGSKLSSIGTKATALVTTPIVGAGTAIVKTTANFESAMSKVSAISGATGDDLKDLTEKAKQMGETTKFSASESADAFQYMAMAGWKTEDMLDGIEGIMNLAAASGEDLALTSDIVTDALTAFGLSAKDSSHFADVLASASSNANTNVAMLGESFKYVAPVAGSLGYSVEDVGVALGLMANSGIKAGQAGTSLRSALSGMIKPSDDAASTMRQLGISMTNSDGTMKSLMEVMVDLRQKMSPLTEEQKALNYQMAQTPEQMGHLMDGWDSLTDAEKKYRTEISVGIDALESMTESELKEVAANELGIKLTKDRKLSMEEYDELAQKLGSKTLNGLSESEQALAASTIFGERAMSGMLAIVNASDEDFNKLAGALDNADGTAKNMADTMNDNLNGQLVLLKSQIEGVAIKLGNILLPIIKKVVDKISEWVDWFSNLSESQQKTILKIAGIVAAIGPLLLIIGKVITAISTIIKIVQTLKTAMIAINAVMAANPILLVVAAIGALVTAFVVLWNKSEKFRNFWKGLWEGIKKVVKPIIDFIAKIFSDAWEKIKIVWAVASAFFKEIWEAIKEIFGPVIEFFVDIFETVWSTLKTIFEPVVNFFQEIWNGIVSIFSPVVDWFKEKFETAWLVIKAVWSVVSDWFKEKWEKIKSIFAPVANWFKEKFQKAINNIKLVFSVITDFFKERWEKIKTILAPVADWFKEKFQKAIDNIKLVWSVVVAFFQKIWDGIKEVFSKVGEWFKEKFQEAWNNITAIWNLAKEFFQKIWDGITAVFSAVGSWFKDKFQEAWDNVKAIWSIVTNFFQGIWDGITGIFSKVGSWFKEKFQEAWNNIKAVFSGIGDFFSGIWDRIKNIFTNVGTKIGESFSGAFKNVVNSVFEFIEDRVNSFIDNINGAIDLINKIPKVNLDHVGYVSLPRLARGGLAYGPTAAIVGDNRNAKSDPEVIAPLSKLKSMFGLALAGPLNRIVDIQKTMSENMKTAMDSRIIDITPLTLMMQELISVQKANYSYNLSRANRSKEFDQDGNNKIPSGDTYNFYTDKSIDEEEAARQIKKVKRDIMEGF